VLATSLFFGTYQSDRVRQLSLSIAVNHSFYFITLFVSYFTITSLIFIIIRHHLFTIEIGWPTTQPTRY